MPFIEWNESLSVRVEKFDAQHKRLIQILNEFHDAMMKGRGRDALENTLNGLVEYVTTHFASEEEAMNKYSFPGLGVHRVEHKNLTEQVLDFQNKYRAGEKYMSIEIMNFLKDWLIFHIMETDKQYGEYFEMENIKIF